MTYTVDAGRQILRDGVRVATVYSKVQTGEREGLFPADADDFTHEIARILNLYPKMVALLEHLRECEPEAGRDVVTVVNTSLIEEARELLKPEKARQCGGA